MIAEELWPDILKKLPVQTLCRLQCVCKSWKSLLSSTFFANHRLEFTIADPQVSLRFLINGNCVLHHQQDNTFTPPLHLPLQTALHHYNSSVICLGVIHGVACLYYRPKAGLHLSGFIALWNPAIRKYLTIPGHLDYQHIFFGFFIGFGFDSLKSDFKVVKVEVEGDHYEVFSARNSLWKRKALHHRDHLKSLWNLQSTNCFVNGAIYWTTFTASNNYSLLLFDCGREEFTTMDLPQQLDVGSLRVPILFVWGGLLTVLKFVSEHESRRICEVWVMQREHGGTFVWSRLHPIDHTGGDIIAQQFRVTPYDYEKEQFQFECIDGRYKDAYVFEESMLLMDIGKHCDPDEDVDANTDKRNRARAPS